MFSYFIIMLAVIVADEDYPSKVAMHIAREVQTLYYSSYNEEELKSINSKSFSFLNKYINTYILEDVNWPIVDLDIKIKKYQDPKEADKLLKLQTNLEEVTSIMNKNLDDVRF